MNARSMLDHTNSSFLRNNTSRTCSCSSVTRFSSLRSLPSRSLSALGSDSRNCRVVASLSVTIADG